MALDSLQRVIEKLQKTIEAHRSYLAENETRTRQVLIDPLLRKLGWDVSNPNMVHLEYSVKQERADYALMPKGKRLAVIEAKRLGTDLDDRVMQVLNYANAGGFPYMILTNGDKWEMYKVFEPAILEERLLMKLELSQQPADKNAEQALAMRKSNLTAKEPDFEPPKPAMNRSSVKPNKLPKPQPPGTSPKNDNERYPFASEERLYPRDPKPTELKIDGNPKKTVKAWKDVMHEVVTWLIDEGILSGDDCPIRVGKRSFIDLKGAVNPNGTKFKNPQALPKGLILQRSIETNQQWPRLKKLLIQFDVDLRKIEVFY